MVAYLLEVLKIGTMSMKIIFLLVLILLMYYYYWNLSGLEVVPYIPRSREFDFSSDECMFGAMKLCIE